jgi:WD40 repeat protein
VSHLKASRPRADTRRRPLAHRLLMLALSAAVTSFHVARASQPAGFAEAGPTDKAQRRTDLYGDPLPPGAVARMGTSRLWMPDPGCPITFAPDGKTLVSLVSGTAVAWEADTGRLIRRLFPPDKHGPERFEVWEFGFSPDGKSFAACDTKTILICETSTGQTAHVLRKDEGAINHLAFAADGRFLASAGAESNSRELERPIGSHSLASSEWRIRVWDLRTGQQVRRFSDLRGGACACALSPDGAILATGRGTETIRLWDVASGILGREFRVRGLICSIEFEADGKTLTSIVADGVLTVWDLVAGKETRRIRLNGWKTGLLPAVLRSPDRKLIAGPGEGAPVGIWEAATGKQVRQVAGGCAFSPDGKTIAVISTEDDLTIGLWDISTGKEKLSYPRHHGSVLSLAFAPGDNLIGSVDERGTVRLWDVSTGKEVRRILDPPPGLRAAADADKRGRSPNVRAQAFAFAPDGEKIVSWNNDETFALWDVASGKEIRRIHPHLPGPMSAVAFGPDGRTVAAVSGDDRAVGIWDMATGREVRRGSLHHNDSIASLCLARDGKTIASGGLDGTARLWDTTTFRRLSLLDASQDPVFSIDISPDGKTICVGGADAILRLWKPDTGEVQESAKRDVPDEHMIHTVAFAPDGNRVAWSGIDDGIVRIWDVKQGREVGQFPGQHEGVHLVVFSRNSRFVASANGDGTILVWDVAHLNR